MCVICVKEKGFQLPSKETLENCFKNNPDGAGFMFTKAGLVRYEKGFMTFESFYDALKKHFPKPRIEKQVPVILHFRIGTHGDKRAPTHTHPFPVTRDMRRMVKLEGDVPLAVVHNGIIQTRNYPKYSYTNEDGSTLSPSDTMEYVREIIAPIARINAFENDLALKTIINETLGFSKLVVLRGDGKLYKYGDFQQPNKDEQVFFSNNSYETSKPKYVVIDDSDYGYNYDYDDSLFAFRSKHKTNQAETKIKPKSPTLSSWSGNPLTRPQRTFRSSEFLLKGFRTLPKNSRIVIEGSTYVYDTDLHGKLVYILSGASVILYREESKGYHAYIGTAKILPQVSEAAV